MKILITGHMGYVGPRVVRFLREKYPDAIIIGLDMGYFAHHLTTATILPECCTDLVYFGDVRKPPGTIFQDTTHIIHLAAISNDPMGKLFEEPTLQINAMATAALAQRAKNYGARSFVLASSCSIYGDASVKPITEESPLNPLTAYARSKVLAEDQLEKIASPDFVVTSLRFATACGMSERLRLDLVLNDFVASSVATGKVRILSDGSPWRPLIHVDDMARAIGWAIERDMSTAGAFTAINVGSEGMNFQVRDIAKEVARVIPGTEIMFLGDGTPDKRSYRVSFEKFRRLAPLHQPLRSLEDAILGLKSGLEEMCFKDGEFRQSHYMRLEVLKKHVADGRLSSNLEWRFNGETRS